MEQGLRDALGIPVELGLLRSVVAFGNDHDVNGLGQRAALPDDGGGMFVVRRLPDEDVGWVDPVLQAGGPLPVRVHEEDFNVHAA